MVKQWLARQGGGALGSHLLVCEAEWTRGRPSCWLAGLNVAVVCCCGVPTLCVQSDMTKAANHIDFTSVPYQGPALLKGQELLAAAREKAKQEAATGPSLQRGWYYSGQLDHMVVWEKGACALHGCHVCFCAHVAHATCDVAACARCSQANNPTTVATRFTKLAAQYTAPSQPWPRCAKHHRSDTPIGQPTDNKPTVRLTGNVRSGRTEGVHGCEDDKR